MKQVFLLALGFLVGLLANYFLSMEKPSQEEAPEALIQELAPNTHKRRIEKKLSPESTSAKRLADAFEKITQQNRQKENASPQEKREPFAFLVSEESSDLEFSRALLQYARSEDAQRPDEQLRLLKFVNSQKARNVYYAGVAINSLELLSLKMEEWHPDDSQEIWDEANKVLQEQIKDPYDLARKHRELKSLGLPY